MKKRVLMRHLKEHNCFPTGRQTGSHAQFRNMDNGKWTVVPIHNDINEITALGICKQLGIPPVKFN